MHNASACTTVQHIMHLYVNSSYLCVLYKLSFVHIVCNIPTVLYVRQYIICYPFTHIKLNAFNIK